MNTTERILIKMLKENTGAHMLDSGGAYGRHWERNQKIELEKEPDCTLSFNYDSIDITINLFHWLKKQLEYAPNLQRRFNAYCKKEDAKTESWDQKSWFTLTAEFCEKIDPRVQVINTYNGETLLSQVIQYYAFSIDSDPYIALMIHNGCDVRGGYTAPKFFRLIDDYLINPAQASIYCIHGHTWDTDDSYHFYSNDNALNLENYDIVKKETLSDEEFANFIQTRKSLFISPDQQPIPQIEELFPGIRPPFTSVNYILVDEDGTGYCPLCGNKLSASFFI